MKHSRNSRYSQLCGLVVILGGQDHELIDKALTEGVTITDVGHHAQPHWVLQSGGHVKVIHGVTELV